MATAIAWRGLTWRRQEKEEGEMERPGNPRVGGMIHRVKGAAPAVKSTQASTWTYSMSCHIEARRRTGGIGIGGLAGLKEPDASVAAGRTAPPPPPTHSTPRGARTPRRRRAREAHARPPRPARRPPPPEAPPAPSAALVLPPSPGRVAGAAVRADHRGAPRSPSPTPPPSSMTASARCVPDRRVSPSSLSVLAGPELRPPASSSPTSRARSDLDPLGLTSSPLPRNLPSPVILA
nr:nascent polypeptide-associated complex subunit alpha, muscle-specific form-like [Aegilops tauschii subsp. strangulata]